MKAILIDHFGVDLAFTYPRGKKKSQMFYLSRVQIEDVIKTIRAKDSMEMCAKKLTSEWQEFYFGLDKSFRYVSDLKYGMEKLESADCLQCWNSFFDIMFLTRRSSVAIKRKCEVVFQIVYNLIHNGQRKTPLHIVISQSIHDTCKSKSLIQMFNRLGLCISYDDLERVDIAITQEIINLAGPNRVPVPKNINSSSIIHGTMDNFDHEENTLSGIGGSHDTVLLLFQKSGMKDTTEKISTKSVTICGMSANKRSLSQALDCQTLLKRGAFSSRGTIPANFKPAQPPDSNHICMKSQSHYENWLTTRYFSKKIEEIENIPSFSAMNSFLHDTSATKTKVAFTPILPYIATEYNTIDTVMCNFQDILQKFQSYVPLWCGEGVYRLAK